NTALVVSFDLDAAEVENEKIQAKLENLYQLFTREVEAHKAVVKLSNTLPKFLAHVIENTAKLDEEASRLNASYLLA
ncbi:septation ring formation regulator EzrA, partial [Streptococcus pyogenes]